MKETGKIAKYFVLAILFLSFGFLDTNNSRAAQDSGTIDKFFTADQAPQYISMVYTWGSMIVGGLSLIVIAYAGITYMRSMGSPEVIGQSKAMISGALIGLFLVLGGYMLLRMMDPRLVDLKLSVKDLGSLGEGFGNMCTAAQTAPCDPTKDTTSTCIVTWVQCDPGEDTKKDVNINIVCGTDKRWKTQKNSICAVAADENNRPCETCDSDHQMNESPVNCQSGTTCTDVGTGSSSTVGWDVCWGWPGDGRTWYCK